MLEMVVGFLFDAEYRNVMLVKKNRPPWQDGKINGVGGKIEKDEAPLVAMHREFFEETGHLIDNFKNFAILNGSGWRVYFYEAMVLELELLKEFDNDEEIIIESVDNLPNSAIFNIRWLIPLAYDHDIMRPTIAYDKTNWSGLEKSIIWED